MLFLAVFCGPLVAVANFLVSLCLFPVLAVLPKGVADNEWFKGFVMLISAGLVTAALRYYAKTEGAGATTPASRPVSPTPPSDYDSNWK